MCSYLGQPLLDTLLLYSVAINGKMYIHQSEIIYIYNHTFLYIYMSYICIYICVCLFVWDFSSRYLRFTMCFDHPIFCWRSPEKKPQGRQHGGVGEFVQRLQKIQLLHPGRDRDRFFFHVKFAGEDLSELELMGIEFWCEVPWSPISLGLMRNE